MRLYDTAARTVRAFVPAGDAVSLYVCGITPYDGGHLGHAFTYHSFDVLTRRLRSLGHSVRSVRNVTDVDDDMMRVSRLRGIGWQELGDRVVADFDRDMASLDILPVTTAPRASAHVPAMIDWIASLVERGCAYAVDGRVYFEVAQFPEYGQLSRLDPAGMIDLSRQRGADPDDARKRAPLDFVLWQPSLPGEPAWKSPWSPGRPGWHIECSVLATAELGAPIDIHGGGEDLIFPHHESEVAQAGGMGVSPYVRHWVHTAMVDYKGEKMSKSGGNLVFVRELLGPVSGATIRLLLADHHYRQGWEYVDAELEAAETRRRAYVSAARRRGGLMRAQADALRSRFLERIDDDLDTPGALLVADIIASIAEQATPHASAGPDAIEVASLLTELLDLVGAASLLPQPATP